MAERSYEQYCGLARALDVIGSRWSLLIVRELLIGPKRFGELQRGMPGVATNLLTDRLRQLEADGVVERDLDKASNKASYRLTQWGEQLREPVLSLVRWSTPLMAQGASDNDSFSPHWLLLALDAFLHERRSERRVNIALEVDETVIVVEMGRTGTVTRLADEAPQTTFLRCSPDVALGLAAGAIPPAGAAQLGELHGNSADLEAVFGAPQRSSPANPAS